MTSRSTARCAGPLLLAVILALAGAATIPSAHGAAPQSEPVARPGVTIENLQASLRIIESTVGTRELTSDEIDSFRQEVEYVADSALRIRASAMRHDEEEKRLLQALGPKPPESEPPESPRVAAERQRLEDSTARYEGQIKSSNLLLARVDALRARLAREEFGALARILKRRTESPLSPALIRKAASNIPSGVERFTDTIAAWWQSVKFNRKRFEVLVWWLVLLVVGLGIVLPTRNWLLRRYGPDHREENPSFTRRFRVMLAVGLGNVVLPVASILGLYVVFIQNAAPTPGMYLMTSILTVALCQFFLVTGLAAAATSPGYPNWRISHFTDDSAVRLHRSIRQFAGAVVLLNVIRIVIDELSSARRFAQVLSAHVIEGALPTLFGAIVTVAVALTVLHILGKNNWRFVFVDEEGKSGTRPPGRLVRVFFFIAKLGLVLGIAGALAGYVNLGMFLTQRIVWSLLLVAFAYLLREFIAATCRQAAGADSEISSLLHDTLGYAGAVASRLMFWVMLIVDLALVAAVIVALLLFWGVQASDIGNTAYKLFYGISVGNFTFSLLDVAVSLGVFIILFVTVRLFQNFLSKRVLAQTVPDVGVRDALTTSVGYAGIIVAAVIAISTLGVQLSQLALIFGALSVGIGFGLQHVVNNFISGIILLIYRPIKAGDWIVVGQHQGYVKKINVVATELQTFDNADVIIPNSQLVTSEVLNWTHKSTVARVILAVGVAYDSDPRRVRDILLRCAEARKEVLRSPAPAVVFRDFGDSALNFELRFFIRQADYMLLTASDLRFDITDAFREAGIVIPFPQRDIHIVAPDSAVAATVTPAATAGKPAPERSRRRRSGAAEDGGDGDGT
ncbi:MAG: mechanosensitive ion channel domain-containing protein [Arenicellales bacterium]